MDSVDMEECSDGAARVVGKELVVQINAGMLARKLGHGDCMVVEAKVAGGQVQFKLTMRTQ